MNFGMKLSLNSMIYVFENACDFKFIFSHDQNPRGSIMFIYK